MTDLIKKVIKDSLVELMGSTLSQQAAPNGQIETSDVVLPGLSATGSVVSAPIPPPTTAGIRDGFDDSSDFISL